mmetsp:Transcript_42571/g.47380  ORF Transcript_42571/g.47380 Transcript_42571/m.47380 type:complete len:102 (-) Transcript_42571:19-324(-)
MMLVMSRRMILISMLMVICSNNQKTATGRPQQEEKSRRFIFRHDSTRRGNGSGSTGYKERKQKCRRKTNQRRVQLLRYTYCTYSIAVGVRAADDHQQQQLL